jgi:hypothetical protein
MSERAWRFLSQIAYRQSVRRVFVRSRTEIIALTRFNHGREAFALDLLILCVCGHPTSLHDDRGCRAGRHRPCACLRNAAAAVDAAVESVRTVSINPTPPAKPELGK